MEDQTIEFQAKIYVYDLQNCAREFGFKTDEHWEVSMVSAKEKTSIEKKFFPTLSTRILPEMIVGVLASIKVKLRQQLAEKERKLDTAGIQQQELQYIVAYNANRPRG